MEIREATDDDWPEIWPFFRDIVADGETYAYPLDLSSAAAQALWMEPPRGRVVVMVEGAGPGASVLGTAKMGPNRPGRGSHVATASFMVSPAAQGGGIGRALGTYAVEWAREAGFRSMQFNAVVDSNAAAVHLWHSLGFATLGIAPEAFDSKTRGLVGLHVMHRPL
jgi:L-amino acid N-acyltransferase YncA